MNLLILGYSQFVQRKALSALRACDAVDQIDVASRHGGAPEETLGETFSDFTEALEKSSAELVYISTVNSEHETWARTALERGFHVVVDKPATTSLKATLRLVNIAERENRCLAEATVYPFHPLIQEAKTIFEDQPAPRNIISVFSFPAFPRDNFRYQKQLGGGMFLDLGVYAMSPGRIFFGENPIATHAAATGHDEETGIETSFSLLLEFSGGRSLIGLFGIGTTYRNEMTVMGPTRTVVIPRVFTPPPNMSLAIEVSDGRETHTVSTPETDCLSRFFNQVINSIQVGSYAEWLNLMRLDAEAVDMLIRAEEKG